MAGRQALSTQKADQMHCLPAKVIAVLPNKANLSLGCTCLHTTPHMMLANVQSQDHTRVPQWMRRVSRCAGGDVQSGLQDR